MAHNRVSTKPVKFVVTKPPEICPTKTGSPPPLNQMVEKESDVIPGAVSRGEYKMRSAYPVALADPKI